MSDKNQNQTFNPSSQTATDSSTKSVSDRQSVKKASRIPDYDAKAIAAMSFEEAMSELERLIACIDEDQISLDELINQYKQATNLKSNLSKKLDDAELKIKEINSESEQP